MTGFEQFMKWVSSSPILVVIVDTILVIIFLLGLWKKIKNKIVEDEQSKRDKEERIKNLETAYTKIPTLESNITAVKQSSDTILERLNEIESANKKREMRKLQNHLLENYRLYADMQKNPMQAWSEMEANAFWELFEEYESAGGDGFMHSEVQPAMQKLRVVKMSDVEELALVMQSRKA
jgi:energy-converting hydrogenase A subunit M